MKGGLTTTSARPGPQKLQASNEAAAHRAADQFASGRESFFGVDLSSTRILRGPTVDRRADVLRRMACTG